MLRKATLKDAVSKVVETNTNKTVAGVAAKAKQQAATQSVIVCARLKPVDKGETRGEIKTRYQRNEDGSDGKVITVKNLEFALESVFDEQETQNGVYQVAGKDRVEDVLGGRNATILAYGQTGSGKTHTMFGPQEVLSDFMGCDPDQRGIVPNACLHIFESLAKETRREGATPRTVRCTYIEVYNDRLNDLLGGGADLRMLESSDGVSIAGVREEEVASTQEVMSALVRGNSRRVVAAMKMNARSSRGHAILSVQVVEPGELGSEVATKLNLVDLAGMESSKKSFAVEGASNNPARREEAKNINVSLYALGTVIEKLSLAGQGSHVPYRNSKLTRLLQECVGGNSRCAILVTVRTEAQNLDESIATLRLARRAAVVKTVEKRNEIKVKDPTKLFGEITNLSGQLEAQQDAVLQLQAELARRQADEKAVEAELRATLQKELEDKVEARAVEERRAAAERAAKLERERNDEERKAEELRLAMEEARRSADAARRSLEEQAKAAEEERTVRRESLKHIEVERADAVARAEELEKEQAALAKKMEEEAARRAVEEARRAEEEMARQHEEDARRASDEKAWRDEEELRRGAIVEQHLAGQAELMAELDKHRLEEAAQRQQLEAMQALRKEQEDAADDALLEKIEEELKFIEMQQEEHDRLESEMAQSKATAAAQAEQLAELLEAEARRQAQQLDAPGTSPLHAIRTAHELANGGGGDLRAEISKALRSQLLGIHGPASLHKAVTEALEVAAKVCDSMEALVSVISGISNSLVSDVRDTLQTVFENVQEHKVRQALSTVQLVSSVAVVVDPLAHGRSSPNLEAMSHAELLHKSLDMQAQLQALREENSRLKAAAN